MVGLFVKSNLFAQRRTFESLIHSEKNELDFIVTLEGLEQALKALDPFGVSLFCDYAVLRRGGGVIGV